MVYYIGFRNAGDKYPIVDFVDFDFKEARLAPEIAEGAIAMKRGVNAFQYGAPLDARYVPEKLLWNNRCGVYDYLTPHGSTIVSLGIKQIIERFEPGLHQFFPLKVVNKRGEMIAERFLWVVCNRIDPVYPLDAGCQCVLASA